jgi:hypothetical protein
MDKSSVPKAANLDISNLDVLAETVVPPSSTLRMRLVFANFLGEKRRFFFGRASRSECRLLLTMRE